MDITIIVFTGPNVSSFSLDDLGDHVVNQSVFVPQFLSFELFLVGGFVDALEDVLESTVIFLQDGVFGGHVERVVSLDGVLEAGVGEGFNRSIVVEHQESNS